MQAVRQCSACASRAAGGLLRNQSDFPVLQNNNSVFRGAACIRFLSATETRTLGVHKLGEKTSPPSVSAVTSSDARGLFDIAVTQQVENLSQDSLIRRAASVVTDSSSTFLSQTTLALTEALANYAKAVHSRIAFQRRYLASLGKLTAAEEDMLLQVVHGWRAEAINRLDDCKRYESTWITAVNLCKNAAESAENSGAQQASLSMRTNIQVAQSQVEEARKLSADADKKLAETKVEEIQRKAEYAAFNSEEFEIHEAYLRED
uniref:Direct IAP-binding protein with low pI n=1 Tax=Salarias fasciatus TaxID=181472 RepID=A0A672GVT9_SALFA